jgi:hypothetical protein
MTILYFYDYIISKKKVKGISKRGKGVGKRKFAIKGGIRNFTKKNSGIITRHKK